MRGDTGPFPGGRTRLPRLSKPGVHRSSAERRKPTVDGPEVLVTSAAFTRAGGYEDDGENTHQISSSGDATEFGRYYSAESLFDGSRELDVTSTTSDGPYAVLGLTRQASWEQIRRAHRALVSNLHPDRFVGEHPDVIADAERRVRDINEAFSEIRRQRSGNGR